MVYAADFIAYLIGAVEPISEIKYGTSHLRMGPGLPLYLFQITFSRRSFIIPTSGRDIASLLIGFLVLYNNPRAPCKQSAVRTDGVFLNMGPIRPHSRWGSEQPDVIIVFMVHPYACRAPHLCGGPVFGGIVRQSGKGRIYRGKTAIGLFFVPVIFLTHTAYNLLGFTSRIAIAKR